MLSGVEREDYDGRGSGRRRLPVAAAITTLSGPGSGEISTLKPNWKRRSEQRAKWHW